VPIPVFFCLEEALQLPALSRGICKVAGQTSCRELISPIPDSIQTLNRQ